MISNMNMLADNAAEFLFPIPTRPGRPPETLRLRVAALACGAVRITRTMRGTFLASDSPAVVSAAPGRCSVTETPDAYLADCGSITVQVAKETGSIAFLDKAGNRILREREKYPCVLEEKPVMVNRFSRDAQIRYSESVDGVRASADDYESFEARRAYTAKISFDFDPDEALYGLGSHEEGCGSLRGRSRDLYQHNMKAVVPFLVSTKGWGILFDMGCLMIFHDDAQGSYLWADCADEADYYFMAGGCPAVYRSYRALTGAAPLLPRYAFGYIQSKERYKDAAELIGTVKEYRRRQVPLDVIVEDWQSWPEGQWGWKTFDPGRFPDPKAMTDELHAMGAKLMISVWPSMQGDRNEDRAEMLGNGFMLGNRTIYNAFDEGARALYWKQAEEGLFRYGVDAWWCDCSEPFESDWHGRIKPEPFERVHLNTAEAKKYLDPGRISLYSLYHSMGIYQGQRKADGQKRVLNLTRSSWAGQHRYATVTWSGDVSSTWETLRRQVPEGMNFMAAGENYWTTDAGGFFPMDFGGAWFGAGDFNKGVDDLGFRELFVRWMQYAAFLPMMRAHGTGTPREIWQFGEKGDPWYDALESVICLRSRLVPFLYSLAAVYTREGLPMVRFPALDFPQDPALGRVDDEMLLGGILLVKPVTRPVEYLPGSRKIDAPDDTETVRLPAGADWYDWYTGEKHAGGQSIRVRAPLDRIPLFLRAGAVLPLGPVQQYVDENPGAPLTVLVCPGADGTFTWYDDAGDGYGYEQGECASVRFSWNDAAGELTVSAREGGWDGMLPEKEMHIRRMCGKETVIRYTGEAVTLRP